MEQICAVINLTCLENIPTDFDFLTTFDYLFSKPAF